MVGYILTDIYEVQELKHCSSTVNFAGIDN